MSEDAEAGFDEGWQSLFGDRWQSLHPTLVSRARRVLRDPDDADEAVSRAVLGVLERDARGQPVAHPEAYLAVAVRNAAIDVLREKRRSSPIDGLDESVLVDLAAESDLTGLDDHEALEPLRTALGRITPAQRMALVETVVRERSTTDAAVRLERSPTATAALAYRARRALRAELTVALLERGGPTCARLARAGTVLTARHDRTCEHCSDIRGRRGTGRWALAALPAALAALLPVRGEPAAAMPALAGASTAARAVGLATVSALIVVTSVVLADHQQDAPSSVAAGPTSTMTMPALDEAPAVTLDAPGPSAPAPSPSAATEPTPSAVPSPDITTDPTPAALEPQATASPDESPATPVPTTQTPAVPQPSADTTLVPSSASWNADGTVLTIVLDGAAPGERYSAATDGVGTLSGASCDPGGPTTTCTAESERLTLTLTLAQCSTAESVVRITPQLSGSNPVTVRSTTSCS